MISGILTINSLSFVTPILSTSIRFLSMFGGDNHAMKAEMEERVVNQCFLLLFCNDPFCLLNIHSHTRLLLCALMMHCWRHLTILIGGACYKANT